MPKNLTEITLGEVSLVDSPANEGARALLFKRAGGLKTWIKDMRELFVKANGDAKTFDEVMDQVEVRDDVWEAMDGLFKNMRVLEESLQSILSDDGADDKRGLVKQTLDQFKSAIDSALSTLAKAGDLPAAGGGITVEEPSMSEDMEKRLGELEAQAETLKAEVETLKTERDAEKARADELAAKLDAGDEEEDVLKGLPEDVRKRLEASEAKAAEAEAAVAKLRDDQRTAEFVKRCGAFDGLVKAEDFGPVLKAVADADEEAAEKVEAALKAAAEQVKAGKLFEEVGTGGSDSGDTAFAKATTMAEERMREKGGSVAQHRAKIWEENPDLKKQYDEERREAVRAVAR